MGPSGGGWITGAVSQMLAEKGEGDLIAYQYLMVAQISDILLQPGTVFADFEKIYSGGVLESLCELMTGKKDFHNVPYLFPNKMPLATAKKAPMTVIYTCEFDMDLRAAQEARDLFTRAGRLAEYACLRGATHMSCMMDPREFPTFSKAIKDVADKWLYR